MSDEKSCKTCQHLDEYFGDCCHPDGQGCLDPRPAMENCLDKDRAWWVKRTFTFEDVVRAGIERAERNK